MASCDNCGSTILFGGKKYGKYRFCGAKCLSAGSVLSVADQIPADVLLDYVTHIHQGSCPKCKGVGPVDIHTSHSVWSALIMTSWKSTPQISCRPCGVKSQALGAVSSVLLGWWGLPWGLIMTPVQIIKNIVSMVRRPDPSRPSEELAQQARLILASRMQSNVQGPSN